MNKTETIAALEKLGIPHDPEAKADDLKALHKAVTNAASAAADEANTKAIGEVSALREQLSDAEAKNAKTDALEAQVEQLREALSNAAKDPAPGGVVVEAENEEFVALVQEKMSAGLTKEQAVQVATAQAAHDAAQEEPAA